MPKATPIDKAKANKRKAAIATLRARPMADEKSVAKLRDQMALFEAILGLEE